MNIQTSVALAAYNGEKYISQQIKSIVSQLAANDELVISYNESSDQTYAIITDFAQRDNRIKVIDCMQKGVNANFNNAILHCSGKYIFLCDQDDIWLPNKLSACIDCFQKTGAQLIMHNAYIVNDSLKVDENHTIFQGRIIRKGILKKLFRSSYHGCCMAFSSTLKKWICPIPNGPFFHDVWIGIIAEMYHQKVVFLDKKLILYRRHKENNSSETGRTLWIKLYDRIHLIYQLILRKMTFK